MTLIYDEMPNTCYFFGTFNPIHQGHLLIADQALSHYGKTMGFDTVTFVPAGVPPHRSHESDLLPAEDRYEMVRLAVSEHPGFRISDIELQKSQNQMANASAENAIRPSYTAETLRVLVPEGHPWPVPFVIGADALSQLGAWHEADWLAKHLVFLVAGRPGSVIPNILEYKSSNAPSTLIALTTHCIDLPELALSSTWVRRQLVRYANQAQTSGTPTSTRLLELSSYDSGLQYLVPPRALRYLLDNNLYRCWLRG